MPDGVLFGKVLYLCIFKIAFIDTKRVMTIRELKKRYKSTLKSSETEDWLDYRVVRPLSYLWALFFAKLGIHPNTVTIISMFIGAAASIFFMHGSFYYEGSAGLWFNIIGILLLCQADILDCTDGQLARLTGKKSRLGRILDGIAGFTWFIPIYALLIFRFYNHHSIEFGWFGIPDTEQNALIATAVVTLLAFYSGFAGMGGQQRLADYYIQIHLFLLKGEKGSELDSSAQQQRIYDETPAEAGRLWKNFLKTYINYTRKQEEATPEFQRLLGVLRDKYGNAADMPEEVRQELLRGMRGIMPLNAMLTFNFRSAMFFLFCLIDLPVGNFLFEAICMGLLARYVNHRYEACCRRVREKIIHNS